MLPWYWIWLAVIVSIIMVKISYENGKCPNVEVSLLIPFRLLEFDGCWDRFSSFRDRPWWRKCGIACDGHFQKSPGEAIASFFLLGFHELDGSWLYNSLLGFHWLACYCKRTRIITLKQATEINGHNHLLASGSWTKWRVDTQFTFLPRNCVFFWCWNILTLYNIQSSLCIQASLICLVSCVYL